jgi:hypothetical protein
MFSREYEELAAEQAAREDYLHEAYGREARMLDDQARDDAEQEQAIARDYALVCARAGFTVEEADRADAEANALPTEYDAEVPF